jgi:hypothetical protein
VHRVARRDAHCVADSPMSKCGAFALVPVTHIQRLKLTLALGCQYLSFSAAGVTRLLTALAVRTEPYLQGVCIDVVAKD